MVAGESELIPLVEAIASGDVDAATRILVTSPALATASVDRGATRQESESFYFDEICHYVYAGDTALHVAAAAHRPDVARSLVESGADLGARNRRGAEPLHYAADGVPGSDSWRPDDQAATITYLIGAGADPNALDKSGVAPLHRAVRTRCAAAVGALLDGGADPRLPNKSGSTPMKLASRTTGRGGSGSAEAKAQQDAIIQLLDQHGTT